MKKLSLLFSLLFLFFISCNQNSDQEIQPTTTDAVATSGNTNYLASGRPIAPTMYQVFTSAGQYVSSYGGGITFGTSFIRNTTVDATGATDGEPSGGFSFINPQAGSVAAYSIDGNYFGILIAGGGGGTDAGEAEAWLEEYMDGLFAGGDGGRVAAGGRTANVPGGGSGGAGAPPDGMTLISGQVVRDHNSPTNASVTTVDYVYSPGNPPGGNGGQTGQCTIPFCRATKSGDVFIFYVTISETSGTICKVEANNGAGQTYLVTGFSLHYTSNFTTATVFGTVTLEKTVNTYTTYTFNDSLPIIGF